MMTLPELRDERERLRSELRELRAAPASAGRANRIGNLATGLRKLAGEIADVEHRLERVRALSADPRHCEGPPEDTTSDRSTMMKTKDDSPLTRARDAVVRAMDGLYERNEIDEASGQRCIDVSDRDRSGHDSEYIAAVSDPVYLRAFGRLLASPHSAASLLAPDEAAAVQRVARADQVRGLAVGEGATGGFAIPSALDPTIILTSAGAVSPLRELASKATITVSEWLGVSSAGVTAGFAAEEAEAADKSPELAQPAIKPEKAHAWVPFTIEAGEDWGTLQAELGRLFQDAKATLEATKFLKGSGEDEPFGLLTGATEVVETAEAGKFGVSDVYSAQEALPPRFQGAANWLTSLTIANVIHRFSSPGGEEPALFNEDRTKLLGKPWNECSDMDTKVEESKKLAIYGDVAAGFKVVDRVGARVELVPHVMGENNRPLGVRGLYFYWRVGSKVVNKAALRVLEVK